MKGKSKSMRITAAALCAVLAFGCSKAVPYVLANNKNLENSENLEKTAVDPRREATGEDARSEKEETVYVLANADGSVKKLIVSNWITNPSGADALKDKSELMDIENVKGDEGYTIDSENGIVWDANGNDIYYQGSTEKELPVSVSVTYFLDGREIAPQELAGKSGKVTIRFSYDNYQYEYVEISGEQTKIHVPFAMLTGMLLDNDVFANVEVLNGKIINDGDHTAVVGIAFPGLSENLAIEAEEFSIPDFVEITADVTNFEFGTTVTVAANGLFDKVLDKIDGLDTDADAQSELSGTLGALADAMEQLLDGSSKLYDGLCTLLEKSGELTDGIQKLADGAKELKEGTDELNNGAAQLSGGAAELSDGLDKISSNNESLNGGAKQVFETLLDTAGQQLAAAGLEVPKMTIENYAAVLDQAVASLDKDAVYQMAVEQVTEAVKEQQGQIEALVTSAIKEEVKKQVTAAALAQVEAQVTAAVREGVAAQVIKAATQMEKEDYEAAVGAGLVEKEAQAAVDAAIAAQMESDEVGAMIAVNTKEQAAGEAVQALIASNVEQRMESEEVKVLIAGNTEAQVQKAISDNMESDAVKEKLAAASEGAKSVIALKASLDSYNTFYAGLKTYTAGVAEAASGAKTLKDGAGSLQDGTKRLADGANELMTGILTLQDGVPALTGGIKQLRDGAGELSDGLGRLNEDGIQKIVKAVDGDLEGLLARVRATCDISKDYHSFSGMTEDMDGQVKFIYRTDSIKAEE